MAKKKAKKSGSERRFESFMEKINFMNQPNMVPVGNSIDVDELKKFRDEHVKSLNEQHDEVWPVINNLTLQDGRIVRGK